MEGRRPGQTRNLIKSKQAFASNASKACKSKTEIKKINKQKNKQRGKDCLQCIKILMIQQDRPTNNKVKRCALICANCYFEHFTNIASSSHNNPMI